MQVNTILYYTKTYTVASIVLGKATHSIKCMYLRSESDLDVFMRHLSAVTFKLRTKTYTSEDVSTLFEYRLDLGCSSILDF